MTATDHTTTAADRPDDCTCVPEQDGTELPCFACYQAGFDAPNPDGPAITTDA